MNPCGSGQRLWRNRRYGTGGLGVTDEAHDWSYGREGFPLYCTHCAFMNEALPIHWIGYPVYPSDPPEDFDRDPCTWYWYKDPADIPDRHWERYGLERGRRALALLAGQREGVEAGAAVDADRLAGHVAGLLGREEGDKGGDLGRVGHAPGGQRARQRSRISSGIAITFSVATIPGSTALAVIPRGVLRCDRPHHPDQPGLRGGVGGLTGQPDAAAPLEITTIRP